MEATRATKRLTKTRIEFFPRQDMFDLEENIDAFIEDNENQCEFFRVVDLKVQSSLCNECGTDGLQAQLIYEYMWEENSGQSEQ